MKHSFFRLSLSLCVLSGTAYGDNSPLRATVQAVSGRLFDERTGQWGTEDALGPGFAPVNALGAALLVVVTIDLGARCVIPAVSAEEALAVARGERPPPSRPTACDKPPGKVFADLRYADGSHDRSAVALSTFFTAFDGKLKVPLLLYRRRPCEPLELSVWTSTQRKPERRRVEFHCQE